MRVLTRLKGAPRALTIIYVLLYAAFIGPSIAPSEAPMIHLGPSSVPTDSPTTVMVMPQISTLSSVS